MPSNRFDFLELSDQAAPAEPQSGVGAPADAPGGIPDDSPAAPGPPVAGPKSTLGSNSRGAYAAGRRNTEPRLAEVRVDDLRGYEGILKGGEDGTAYTTPWRQYGPGRALKPVELIGGRGERAGEFNFPGGIAVDRAGILFIADSLNHRLQRITPDGGVSIIGTRGVAVTQFQTPAAVAVDDRRAFYIVEQGNHRVQKFTFDGTVALVFGEQGMQIGQLRAPMGIAVSPVTGEIIVADTGNNRVSRYSQNGAYIGPVGDQAPGKGQTLLGPQAVCCDRRGTIYIADTRGNRITYYDPAGKLLGQYSGRAGYHSPIASANIEIEQPHAIACTETGQLIFGDGDSFGRITVVDVATGEVVTSISNAGRQLGPLARPCGIAVTPLGADGGTAGDVYVADTLNHRILRFNIV